MQSSYAKTLFVTGATGFLGSHFLYSQSHNDVRFIVLVRAGDEEKAWERIVAALHTAFASYRADFDAGHWRTRCAVVCGDICAPMCGIADDKLEWLRSRHIDQFWHFAATLNFEEKSRDVIRQQNVEGTRHVLQLAQSAGIPAFVYCSTAYSAGRASPGVRVPEAIHSLPREFNNYYEESKFLAEHEVRDGCVRLGLAWAILRPSIVIGPRSTKSSGGTRSGMYGFLGSLFRMRKALGMVDHPLVVNGNPHTRLNLVPVDDLLGDVAHYSTEGFQNGTIVHLTSDGYPDIGQALRHTSGLLGIKPMEIRPTDGESRSPLEKVLDRRTEFHASYIQSELEFERSLPRSYGVNNLEFAGFITEAFREFAQESPEDVFEVAVIPSFDRVGLTVYRHGRGGRSTVVLVNAIGMPVEFWTRFAKQLGADFDVITWESRGCPNLDPAFDDHPHRFDHHTRDLLWIMDHFGVVRAQLVGWCSGAQIALKAARDCPERITGVASLNGSFGLTQSFRMTTFETRLREIMPKIAADRRLAEIYFNIVYGNRKADGVDVSQMDEKQQQASSILSSVDPALMHLTSRPFESVGSLFRYASLLAASLQEETQDWIGGVKVPVFVYSGEMDQTSHPDASRWLARSLDDSSLMIDESGDHFSFYRDDSVMRRVGEYLDRATAPVALSA